ncbi:MAG: hypothetical protein FJ359_01800 [Thaumarchaeota archaeon]|nr:hypothetical protein [Nitrososphaerota archaeon]
MSALTNSEKKSSDVKTILEQNVLNSVMCSDPYVKTAFFIKLVDLMDLPIVYLDFDLLYSGYLTAKIVPECDKLQVFQPTRDNWNDLFRDVIASISKQKSLLIFDSLNGFFSLFYNKKDVGMFVNSCIMLLSATAKLTDSSVVVASMAKKEDQVWVLETIGRQIIDAKNMTKMQLELKNSKIKISNSTNVECVIPIDFELR